MDSTAHIKPIHRALPRRNNFSIIVVRVERHDKFIWDGPKQPEVIRSLQIQCVVVVSHRHVLSEKQRECALLKGVSAVRSVQKHTISLIGLNDLRKYVSAVYASVCTRHAHKTSFRASACVAMHTDHGRNIYARSPGMLRTAMIIFHTLVQCAALVLGAVYCMMQN